jgi:hypothetical protein
LGGPTFGAGTGVGSPGDGCGVAPVAELTIVGLAVVAGRATGGAGVETAELAFVTAPAAAAFVVAATTEVGSAGALGADGEGTG